MFPPVSQVLHAAAAVEAIVGTRIGRHGEVGQDEARPYITWFVVTATPENTLSDLPDIDQVTVQINCFHADDAGVETLAKAVIAAIEPYALVTGTPVDQRDPETRLYWVAVQADWWLPRD